MSDKDHKITLHCLTCNESIDIEQTNIEIDVPIFANKHPQCILEGFVNGRSLGPFTKFIPKDISKLN